LCLEKPVFGLIYAKTGRFEPNSARGNTYTAAGNTYLPPDDTYHLVIDTYLPVIDTYLPAIDTYHLAIDTYLPVNDTYHLAGDFRPFPGKTAQNGLFLLKKGRKRAFLGGNIPMATIEENNHGEHGVSRSKNSRRGRTTPWNGAPFVVFSPHSSVPYAWRYKPRPIQSRMFLTGGTASPRRAPAPPPHPL
jgi:hypothetical protein